MKTYALLSPAILPGALAQAAIFGTYNNINDE